MRNFFLLAPAFLQLALVSPGGGALPLQVPADVAVTPFTVEHDSAGVLRAVADSCLERLVTELTAKGITVRRHASLSEENLRSVLPTPWAVVGHLSREAGQFRAEIRLLEVESGEEMRSYFNAAKDPKGITELGAAAARRIAVVVQERKGSPRDSS